MSSDTGKRPPWLLPWAVFRCMLTNKSVCTWGGAAVPSGSFFFPSRLVSLITQLTIYAHLPAKSPKSLLLMKSRATSYALQLCKGSWTVTVARRGLLRRSRPGPALCPCLWCLGGLQAQPQPSCSGGLCKMSVDEHLGGDFVPAPHRGLRVPVLLE